MHRDAHTLVKGVRMYHGQVLVVAHHTCAINDESVCACEPLYKQKRQPWFTCQISVDTALLAPSCRGPSCFTISAMPQVIGIESCL